MLTERQKTANELASDGVYVLKSLDEEGQD